MYSLPKRIGPMTITELLSESGLCECYVGHLDEAPDEQVVIRRMRPEIAAKGARLTSIEARVRDLIAVEHPSLVGVREWVVAGRDRFVIEQLPPRLSLATVISRCRELGITIPHHILLHIAAQTCNALDALHARGGRGTGDKHVLHLALRPGAIFLDRQARVTVGSFGLARSPLSQAGTELERKLAAREYLSPEQTKATTTITPASDIFSLGTVIYEMASLEPLFLEGTPEATLARLQKADITTEMLSVKKLLPGVEKILFRALAPKPEHRYTQAFVLREDLRGLTAGLNFADIDRDCERFLGSLFTVELDGTIGAPQETQELPKAQSMVIKGGKSSQLFPPQGAAGVYGFVSTSIPAAGDKGGPRPLQEQTTHPRSNVKSAKPRLEEQRTEPRSAAQSAPPPIQEQQTRPTPLREQPTVPSRPPEGAPKPPPLPELTTQTTDTTNKQVEPVVQQPPTPQNLSEPAELNLEEDYVDYDPEFEKRPNKAAIWAAAIAAVLVLGVILSKLSAQNESTEIAEVAVVTPPPPPPEPAVIEEVVEEPEEEVVEEPEPEPEPAPVARRPAQRRYTPPAENYSAVAYYPEPEPVPEDVEEEEEERIRTDISRFVDAAHAGDLGSADSRELEAIGVDDESYTQSRALLLIDAEVRRDARDVKLYLDQLFQLDENRYNPVFLSKRARWSVNNARYGRALADAQKAEQHWARIPPSLVFETKAEIFEVQAASLQGLFYDSEDDVGLLDKAVRGWEKYIRHVTERRSDLVEHANEQIRRLRYARTRLQ